MKLRVEVGPKEAEQGQVVLAKAKKPGEVSGRGVGRPFRTVGQAAGRPCHKALHDTAEGAAKLTAAHLLPTATFL